MYIIFNFFYYYYVKYYFYYCCQLFFKGETLRLVRFDPVRSADPPMRSPNSQAMALSTSSDLFLVATAFVSCFTEQRSLQIQQGTIPLAYLDWELRQLALPVDGEKSLQAAATGEENEVTI